MILFDPLDAEGRTARFNPLGHIDRADPIAVLDELQRLAVMLFPAPDNADPFWAEAARTGFIGVGAYVAETPCLAPVAVARANRCEGGAAVAMVRALAVAMARRALRTGAPRS